MQKFLCCLLACLALPVLADPNVIVAYPKVDYGTGAEADLIKRGEYLAKAGDCIACHTDTDNKGAAFAGGLKFNTPFGAFYSANITPDTETGIGKWSDKDFIRALHEGINPKGQYYFPVFPFTSFTKVSDQDLLAIKAYLMHIPAVHKENQKPGAPFPFSWRFSQLGWRILFLHKGYYQADASKNALWNRGAYLVQGLGHCGECHTPRNFLGGSKNSYYLTGGAFDKYYAPDITKVGLKNVSMEDIENVLQNDELPHGGGPITGPMSEVAHDSMAFMTKRDLVAIAYYLKNLESKEPNGRGGALNLGHADASKGQAIYDAHCAACHASGAAGAPKVKDVQAWAPRIAEGFSTLVSHAWNGFNAMPAKGMCNECKKADIENAVAYMVTESAGNGEEKAATPVPQAKPIDAKAVYTESCASCHDAGAQGNAPKFGDKAAFQPIIARGVLYIFTTTLHSHADMNNAQLKKLTVSDMEAATIYLIQNSQEGHDYHLWQAR